MNKLEKNKFYLISMLLMLLYFSTKMFWDSYTIMIELISILIIGIISIAEIKIILFNGNNTHRALFILWCTYIIYIILNGLFNNFGVSYFSRALYEYCFYSCILWYSIYYAKHIDIKIILKFAAYIGIVLSILSFCEFIFKFHFIDGVYSNYLTFNNSEIIRAKVFTRSYLSHGVLLGIFSICNAYSYKISKNKIFIVGAILCFISILTTGSRGPLVATSISYLIYFLLENRIKLKSFIKSISFVEFCKKYYVLIFIVIVSLSIIILNIQTGIYFIDYSILRIRSIFNWSGDAGNLGRLEIWNSSFNLVKDHLLFGIGASKTGSWNSAIMMVTESDYLKKMVELGLVGSILYYVLPVYILYRFFYVHKQRDSDCISICYTLISIIVLILIDSIILQVTEEIMVAYFYWLSLGFLFSMSSINKRKVVLYYSNVDWYWIKQRPHFIAEGLSDFYDIKFVYQHRYNRKIMQKNRNSSKLKKVYPIYVIPKGDRINCVENLNNFIKKIYITIYVALWNVDIIILTYPKQINSVPHLFFNNKIMYDCMDNYIAFTYNELEKNKLLISEKKLIDRSMVISISSEKLKEELTERNSNFKQKKYEIIRNAFYGKIVDIKISNNSNTTFKMCYFGTISSWFDINLLLDSLKLYQNIEYYIYGPIDDGIEIPSNDKIHYMGIAEHGKLEEIVSAMDCLIMPFVVNELIESVDPVKLYEYINFNKNIITVYYNEIRRFEPFVYFYHNKLEFYSILDRLQKNDTIKYSNKQRIDFLKNNNWDSRVLQFKNILDEIEENK